MTTPLLSIQDLVVRYQGQNPHYAVDGMTLTLNEGESLGLIGESGCGKSTLAKAIFGLLDENAVVERGAIYFQGNDLLSVSEEELRKLRWNSMSIIPQSSMNALNPVYTVGRQISEAILAHQKLKKSEALKRVQELLKMVGVPPHRHRDFPHQFSGGMKQRICLAMAFALKPKLVIADEPTTALDVILQAHILNEISKLQKQTSVSLILISHDISLVSERCDRVAVMYGGRMVETGPVEEVFQNPLHPYTMGLIHASPSLGGDSRAISIPGAPPSLTKSVSGCGFANRCPFVEERCHSEIPSWQGSGTLHTAACHFVDRAEEFRKKAGRADVWLGNADAVTGKEEGVESKGPSHAFTDSPLLTIRNLQKRFIIREGLFSSPDALVAVDNIDLHIYQGEVLGIIGESGSGKSVTAEMIVKLQEPTAGEVWFQGQDITRLRGGSLREFRRKVQMVFQDPFETLNPRFTVLESVADPWVAQGERDADRRYQKVLKALRDVGLIPPEKYLDRLPHQLSGGERQRVAIARAIVLEPSLIVADEPTSMLDVSLRAGILDLFRNLRNKYRVSILFISHDFSSVSYLCDRVAVMYKGRIVEEGPTQQVIRNPRHPYTKGLIEAVPRAGRKVVSDLPPAEHEGERTNTGCFFAPRCKYSESSCSQTTPSLEPFPQDDRHRVACFFAESIAQRESSSI